MDVFDLNKVVIADYERFARSFTKVRAGDIQGHLDQLYAGRRFWPEPLVQISPRFQSGGTISELVRNGVLAPECAQIFADEGGTPLTLHRHQLEATVLAHKGQSFIVTTGTGSGKSLCFFIPIIDSVIKARASDSAARTRAIVIYPMNALANSQHGELKKFLEKDGATSPVTFARFTGQEGKEERARIAANPPDILLTNFMMLELLMTRQDEIDRKVIANCEGLSFLVLDELHTYRGRQGADVAMLVRRVRERLVPSGANLQCIGTSATMASEGKDEDRAAIVANVASSLFATPFDKDAVIHESLERATDPRRTADSVAPHLRSAVTESADQAFGGHLADDDISGHPLAIWIETTLGLHARPNGMWVRAQPLTLADATRLLATQAGTTEEIASAAIRNCLLEASRTEKQRIGYGRERPFFAFKLHQFISGAGKLHGTLEPPGTRHIVFDGQQFDPESPTKRLYAIHFCRSCGQEFHPVTLRSEAGARLVVARDIETFPVVDDGDEKDTDEQFGFLMPEPEGDEFGFTGRPEDYPEAWQEVGRSGEVRLKLPYRKRQGERVRVASDGKVDATTGVLSWFFPGHFSFCPACGEAHDARGRDINRLAGLTAEGRSSATTVLVASVLRWMHGTDAGIPEDKRKLLGFTDNRQDAALQAGHFNDFVFVSLLRAGFLRALANAGPSGLSEDRLGEAMQVALGFTRDNETRRREWLIDPELVGVNLLKAEETLRAVLAHRVWIDQRRGWRYTNPSLEELGLITADYLGIDEVARNDDLFGSAPDIVRLATPTVRAKALRELCENLRRGLAIDTRALADTEVEALKSRSLGAVRPPWGFGGDEKPRPARTLITSGVSRKEISDKDEAIILRGGRQSALGRSLASPKVWGQKLVARDYPLVLNALLSACVKYGLVVKVPTAFRDVEGWRLAGQAVQFRAETVPAPKRGNEYFAQLYQSIGAILANERPDIFEYEAREHTAQVDTDHRLARERRFRYGEEDRAKLTIDVEDMRRIGEANRFLPVLFCSPTMELGVDISSLNTVYLRNVPPTPANYAQRSGRAGRSGQAALVLTYCSAQGPHDQYFFERPAEMVQGVVRPPALDLANQDLVESHLHAVWLAATRAELSPKISEILDLTKPGLPVRADLMAGMTAPAVGPEAERRILGVLAQLRNYLTPEKAPWASDYAALARRIAETSSDRFEAAFKRWRDLFQSAERLRKEAERIFDDHSSTDNKAAKTQHRQALEQLELLKQGTESASSDFFTYRYLATEAFLPGYNFPRLPLMAYVPASTDGTRKQTFLQRARFIAIAEFGPRSLIYHEGRAYRVTKAILKPESVVSNEGRLATQTVWVCRSCGAGHEGQNPQECHACGGTMAGSLPILNVYRIDNVDTWPAERITANDEDRQRQGFELRTTFSWALRDGRHDIRIAEVEDADGQLCSLTYGVGATLRRLNLGLRRRRDKQEAGFYINPRNGKWAKNPDEDDTQDPTADATQLIVPAVEDRKQALLLRFPGVPPALEIVATLQQALLRGIEAEFQVEESEILVEALPTRDERNALLFYEAAEGGAGVLNRLVADQDAMARIARHALRIMHFDLSDEGIENRSDARCVAGCYRCLLSYFNQPDHEQIDRQNPEVTGFLVRLSRSRTIPARMPLTGEGECTNTDWLAAILPAGAPPPDSQPLAPLDGTPHAIWRKYYLVATPTALSEAIRSDLEAKGMTVVIAGSDSLDQNAARAELAGAFGTGGDNAA